MTDRANSWITEWFAGQGVQSICGPEYFEQLSGENVLNNHGKVLWYVEAPLYKPETDAVCRANVWIKEFVVGQSV